MSTFVKIGAHTYNTADWQVPSDRVFRNAWEASDPSVGAIQVNMDQAKEIWRDKIRGLRVAEFEKLDTAFMKAMETGADTTEIIAKKQLLRDAPADPAIDAATTPEELKAVQPISGVIVE